MRQIEDMPGLLSFWDFSGDKPLEHVARGPHPYVLREAAGPMQRISEGPFGSAVVVREGQWLRCPRSECPALNLHGKDAAVSVVAWVRRRPKSRRICEAIAGLWDELNRKRQYCLFIGAMNKWDKQVGHVSGVGGPTPGNPFCWTGSVGQTTLPYDRWLCLGFTYDGRHARSYLDGQLDGPHARNPEPYDEGLFDGGTDGSDFTVAAVARSRAPGPYDNFFVGDLGGLAVFGTALSDAEMATVAAVNNAAPHRD
jgi:hypothetical protein